MRKDNIWFNQVFLEGKRPYVWIASLGFLVYARSIFFGFTYLDDHVLILDYLFFLKNISNIFRTFTMEVFHILHASAAYYRPMLTISYMLDAQISGESPYFYHFTSIVVHLVVAVLVYEFLKRLKLSKKIAFLFSVIFVIHPVLSQAVVWIPGRNDSLLALFVLAAFIFFIDYLKNSEQKQLIWHYVFFAFSLFTKESGILLPLVIGLYVLLLDRSRDNIKKTFKVALGWFVLLVIWFFLRSIALGKNPVSYTLTTAITTVIKNSPAVLLYLGKVFLPVNLSVLPTLQDSSLVYGIASFILVLVFVVISKKRNNKLLLFGIAWFLVFLLPSFIRPSSEYVPDFIEHRIYLPIIGLFLALSEIEYIKKINFNNAFVLFGAIALIVSLSTLATLHITNFKDRLTFWKNAVANSPSHPLAHKNLGAMYYLDGNLDLAEKEFRESLELNPKEPMIHNNIGLIYLNKKEYSKAEEEFKKELEINPLYDNAFYNWGLMYYQTGKKEEAEKMWLKTLEINPDHTGAYQNLAAYYAEIGDDVKARVFYYEAVKRGAKF